MLRRNQKVEVPTQIIFVDTETRGEQIEDGREKHTLWFGHASYYRKRIDRGRTTITDDEITFYSAAEFWDWVEDHIRPHSKCYVFAHNWNFDGAVLWTATELQSRDWVPLQYINENPPFLLRLKQGRRYLSLIDSLNYFTMSLASLGESVGISKLSFPQSSDRMEDWIEYCKRDVTVLRKAVLDFIDFVEREDLGNFRPTLASQAMNAYRHRFMKHQIMIHENERAIELERDSYFGGRVECFQIGKVNETLYYLDVNSLYPSVMADNEYPTAIDRYHPTCTIDYLRELLTTHSVTARVRVVTDEPVYPFYKNQRLMFPTGEFLVALSTPELLYALEHGHIKEVCETAAYKRAPIFGEYVNQLYAARRRYAEAGNPAFSFMCKIMLNSLYGKFGQKAAKWEDVRQALPDDPIDWFEQEREGAPVLRYRNRAGLIQVRQTVGESADSFPAIAAHVTAYGRMKLWSLMQKAGRETVFYCDTDSLVVNETGYSRLISHIDAARLGALKLEYTVDSAEFRGAKDYTLGTVNRIKGIRKDAIQLSENEYQQTLFHSWDYHMQNGEEGFIYIDTVRKHLQRIYGKGNVHSDGRVTPYQFIAADASITV